MSLSHTSTSPLNNIYFLALEFFHIFSYICRYLLAQSNIFMDWVCFLRRSTVLWPTPTFFWAEPTFSHGLQLVKKLTGKNQRVGRCKTRTSNFSLQMKVLITTPSLLLRQLCRRHAISKYGGGKMEKCVAAANRTHNLPHEVWTSNH